MAEDKPKESKKIIKKLRNKYRLVVLNDDTFEEKLSVKLSRLNVFLVAVFGAIILITATSFLIAFTGIREYIPGYSSTELKRQARDLSEVADSLKRYKVYNAKYLANIRNIITGKPPINFADTIQSDSIINASLSKEIGVEETTLRQNVEEEERFNINSIHNKQSATPISFFTPIKGLITSEFDTKESHFGIDIVAKKNEVVKATQDGIVIFADWSVETGHVLLIQHSNNYISVYKHNASLLKKQGEIVKSGEPIAIIGNSGELSTGPHLHFELWFDGNPVDPKNYIAF